MDVTSHIGWEGERSLPYNGVDTFSCMRPFGRHPLPGQEKTVQGMRSQNRMRAKADNIMQRVLGALQMVSEPDPDRCVSEDAELPWGVDCEIPHRLVR